MKDNKKKGFRCERDSELLCKLVNDSHVRFFRNKNMMDAKSHAWRRFAKFLNEHEDFKDIKDGSAKDWHRRYFQGMFYLSDVGQLQIANNKKLTRQFRINGIVTRKEMIRALVEKGYTIKSFHVKMSGEKEWLEADVQAMDDFLKYHGVTEPSRAPVERGRTLVLPLDTPKISSSETAVPKEVLKALKNEKISGLFRSACSEIIYEEGASLGENEDVDDAVVLLTFMRKLGQSVKRKVVIKEEIA